MNYADPRLRSALASEYALGTLRGAARRRFETLMIADPDLAAEVRRWESHLLGLGRDVSPVAPPDRVWRRIESHVTGPAVISPSRFAFWRGLGLAMGLVSIVLALLLVSLLPQPPVPTPGYVSVVRDDQAQAVWVVTFNPAQEKIVFEALADVPLEAEKSLELWLLLDGAAPVSLGLLPASGDATRKLTAAGLLKQAKGVAVSLEPSGGSPTGAPTGPIVYQGGLFKLG